MGKKNNYYYKVIFDDGDIDIEVYPDEEQEYKLFGEEEYDPSNLKMVKKFAKLYKDTRIDKITIGVS